MTLLWKAKTDVDELQLIYIEYWVTKFKLKLLQDTKPLGCINRTRGFVCPKQHSAPVCAINRSAVQSVTFHEAKREIDVTSRLGYSRCGVVLPERCLPLVTVSKLTLQETKTPSDSASLPTDSRFVEPISLHFLRRNNNVFSHYQNTKNKNSFTRVTTIPGWHSTGQIVGRITNQKNGNGERNVTSNSKHVCTRQRLLRFFITNPQMLCLKYVSDPHIGFFGGESARFDEFSVPATCFKINSSDFVLGGAVEQLVSCQKWYKIGKSIFYWRLKVEVML